MKDKEKIKKLLSLKRDNKNKTIEEKIEAIDNNPRLNRIVERRYRKYEEIKKKASGDSLKLDKIDKKYGYNYKASMDSGLSPDETGHWDSFGNNGLLLKAKHHPSMIKTKKVERLLGNKIVKVGGDYYSVPKKNGKGK